LVIAPDDIFIVFSAFFFLCSYTLSIFVWTKIQSATLFHRAIMMLQFFELTSHGFAVAFATLPAPPIKDPSAPNIGRNSNAPPRFAVGSIRFFVTFLLVVFFFDFVPMSILVLAFIAAQAAAAALSLRAESLAVTRPSALSASTLSAACLSVRSLLRIRNVVFPARRVQRIYTLVTSG